MSKPLPTNHQASHCNLSVSTSKIPKAISWDVSSQNNGGFVLFVLNSGPIRMSGKTYIHGFLILTQAPSPEGLELEG